MLEQRSPLLKKIYGDYFIANIVQNKSGSRCILVVEKNNIPVGMFCINGDSLQSSLHDFVGNELQNFAYLQDAMRPVGNK
jgi:predicted transcriptional regulator YheO